MTAAPPKFLRASDLSILPRLVRSGGPRFGGAQRFGLCGVDGASVLAEIIATGRATWREPNGQVLRVGAPRAGEACWLTGADGAQRFGFRGTGGEDLEALGFNPPHYVDAATGEVGALATDMPRGHDGRRRMPGSRSISSRPVSIRST